MIQNPEYRGDCKRNCNCSVCDETGINCWRNGDFTVVFKMDYYLDKFLYFTELRPHHLAYQQHEDFYEIDFNLVLQWPALMGIASGLKSIAKIRRRSDRDFDSIARDLAEMVQDHGAGGRSRSWRGVNWMRDIARAIEERG